MVGKVYLRVFLLAYLAYVPSAASAAATPVWQAPAPATDAPAKPQHVRVVDYGDDLAWNYNQHQYRGGFQNQETI